MFAEELSRQRVNQTDAWIDIPEEVREKYKIYRPTPLVRATGLEKALDTPAHIYFKNESVSPVGSHKLNSALPQAYYNKMDGTTNITTETGAGQWVLPWPSQPRHLDWNCGLYGQNKLRAETLPPLAHADLGSTGDCISQHVYQSRPEDHHRSSQLPGSLGTAISEAIELAMQTPKCKYTLGSVLNHVALHQTIIGLEAEKQMEMAGEYPDVVIGCFGVDPTSRASLFLSCVTTCGREKYPFRGRRTGVVSQAYP